MVPHGGYTVPNSPTRYAYPAPSHDIRASRGAIFALKMANLGGLRNLHFWLCRDHQIKDLLKSCVRLSVPICAARHKPTCRANGHRSAILRRG